MNNHIKIAATTALMGTLMSILCLIKTMPLTMLGFFFWDFPVLRRASFIIF